MKTLLLCASLLLPLYCATADDMARLAYNHPGVVIDYFPASLGLYVGSPSIAILPDGAYVASHDLFGPKAKEDKAPATRVFRSTDRGETWTHACDLRGQFWSTLFVHRGALYILGTAARYSNVVIRRSDDGGRTWTEPTDGKHGLLFEGRYHCAPVPVLEHKGRLWRAMEDNGSGGGWGKHFRSFMLSVPADADLLDASNWTRSNPVVRDPSWLDGRFNGWLEGNAVATPEGYVFSVETLDENVRAYANRNYTWKGVPAKLRGWRFTRTYGGIAPAIRVKAKKDTEVYAMTAIHQQGAAMPGWDAVPDLSLWYTDKGKSRMTVFKRALKAGETIQIPQGNWSGGIVLIP